MIKSQNGIIEYFPICFEIKQLLHLRILFSSYNDQDLRLPYVVSIDFWQYIVE